MINKRYNSSNYEESFSVNDIYWRFSIAHESEVDVHENLDEYNKEETTGFLYELIQQKERCINKFNFVLNKGRTEEEEFDNVLRRLING